jgi:hypothetical protein
MSSNHDASTPDGRTAIFFAAMRALEGEDDLREAVAGVIDRCDQLEREPAQRTRLTPWRNAVTIRLPPRTVAIRVEDSEGRLVAVVDPLGSVRTETDWEAELAAANAARAAVGWLASIVADDGHAPSNSDGDGTTQTHQDVAWAAGFRAGLAGEHVQLEYGPRLPPEWLGKAAGSHRRGWGIGDAMRRALEIAAVGIEP